MDAQLAITGISALACGSLGYAIALLRARQQAQAAVAEIEQQRQHLAVTLASTQGELSATRLQLQQAAQLQDNLQQQTRTEMAALQDANTALREQLGALQAMDREREQKLAELREQIQRDEQRLQMVFENTANRLFDEKSQRFTETNKAGLDALLNPLREQIDVFRRRVDQVHSEQTEGRSRLEQQVLQLSQLNETLNREASNLASALKNNNKTLGNWGEIQVEKLLENAGLQRDREYRREDAFRDSDGQQKRPDFVLYLPEGKHIIIDSKVSLHDYLRSINTDNDAERSDALAAHVKSVTRHIEELAGKNYTALAGVNSPDFIFMFMPIESAYLAAFNEDPSLFNKAYERRIAVVTPNTLLPILRTVASLWNIDKQNQSTRQLAEAAGKIYDKLRIFAEKFEKVEAQLDTVTRSYHDARSTLSGPRSLINMAESFRELGVKVGKSLPARLVEDSLDELSSPALPDETPATE